MQKAIVIFGRTLVLSDPQPASVPLATFSVTRTDVPAVRSSGKGGAAVLIKQIQLSCTCSGTFDPNSTYSGAGTGTIVASTPRVECEGQQLLTEGDSAVVDCVGTTTNTSSGATVTGVKASVTVTITDGKQHNVDANKA